MGEREPQFVMHGHPSEPDTFWFRETRRNGRDLHVIRSHVAYDTRWPWWRRLWADLRGRP